MEVLCDINDKSNSCPSQGVGVYNPGFWGMVCYSPVFMQNILSMFMQNETYHVIFRKGGVQCRRFWYQMVANKIGLRLLLFTLSNNKTN